MILSARLSAVFRTIFITLLLLAASLYWHGNQQERSVQTAVAKGKQLYEMSFMGETLPAWAELPRLSFTDAALAQMLDGRDYGFLNAVQLSMGEARPWREQGCLDNNCAHVSFYNYSDGGTVNAVVNLENSEVLARWQDPDARPGGSGEILQRAMGIAAADREVQAVLGDLGDPDPAMIPMSGWLADNACSQEWCVDLTYQDPEGSGRVFHIFVNMERSQVARTFFTRGRAERSLAPPLLQRAAYSDGCHEQFGWSVCWEMTAHDGINFRDAAFDGRQVFSSVKISQVEAWYPAWPGGYRDEIGFAASVPPFGGTNIVDLGDGFAVSQLFTEFTHWPNCICCYRYEQIIRFFADGAMEFEFVSHGPGCDDIPIYRPFWRIDLNLDGPESDEVWVWDSPAWVESKEEFELHPFVDDLSPDGFKLATFDGQMVYRWKMLLSDPLARDEARFFAVKHNPLEGDGPLVTGPGDTFIPPRQWIDGEQLSGGDVVLWFVPILKQLSGGVWWCMPDPEPDFSPCNSILRAELGPELQQPTAEELAQLLATPVFTVTNGTGGREGSISTPEPASTVAAAATRPLLIGDDAESIILAAGCGSCHAIGALGESHKVGPDLSSIGRVAGERVPGLSAADYIRQSILEPNAFMALDCPNGPCLPNIMPRDYGARLRPEQVDLLVDYLLSLRQELTQPEVIGESGPDGRPTPLPKAFPAPKRVGRTVVSSSTSLTIQLLLLFMLFVLTMFRLAKAPWRDDTSDEA